MITLTDTAKKKMLEKISNRGRGLGILLSVKTTGCSGFSYVFEFCDRESSNLQCVFDDQVCVYVDRKHRNIFFGMTIDYVRKGLNEGFEFVNPNEGDRCGCGQSFTVRNTESVKSDLY